MVEQIFEPSNAIPQSEADIEHMQNGLMVKIRHILSWRIRKSADHTFVMEPIMERNTDVVARRQVGGIILSVTLSPRVRCEQVRRNGSNHIIALGKPYISVYGAAHAADVYLSGDKNGSIIAFRATAKSLWYTGYDSPEEAVDYAMSILLSDWPKQVQELAVNKPNQPLQSD